MSEPRFTVLAPYKALYTLSGYLEREAVNFIIIRQPVLEPRFPWQFQCPKAEAREATAERGHQASEECEECLQKDDCEQRQALSAIVQSPETNPVILCHSSYLRTAADQQGEHGDFAVPLAECLFHDRHVILDEDHLRELQNPQEISVPQLREYVAVLTSAFPRDGISKAASQAHMHLRLARLATSMIHEMPPGPFYTKPWTSELQ